MAFLASINGYKTYLGLAVAGGVLLLHALAGVDIPGVPVDDTNLAQNLWGLAMAAAARHAVAKVVPAAAPKA